VEGAPKIRKSSYTLSTISKLIKNPDSIKKKFQQGKEESRALRRQQSQKDGEAKKKKTNRV